VRYIFILIFLLSTFFSFAQDKEVLSKIPFSDKSIRAFIPPGYDTIMTVTGDLDKDNIADLAMVLKSLKEDGDSARYLDSLPRRILLVLLKNEKGYYMVAGKSNQAILGKDEGGIFGDPLAEIRIIKGILVIDHYGGSAWRWEYTHKFRFQNNYVFLIGQTSDNYWNVKMCDKLGVAAGTDFEDINFVTGSYVTKKVSENCKLLENKKGKKPVKPLVKLEDFTIIN
jgi:hypothetical protein